MPRIYPLESGPELILTVCLGPPSFGETGLDGGKGALSPENDGLPEREEDTLHNGKFDYEFETNPGLWDSDGNGLADGKVTFGTACGLTFTTR